MSNSRNKKISNNFLSYPNSSPNIQPIISNNPFSLISQGSHNATSHDPFSNNFQDKKNNFRFQPYDLYRNPMIESIDGDFPQMIESQMINQLKINQSPNQNNYLNQYEVDEQLENHEQKDCQTQGLPSKIYPNPSQKSKNTSTQGKKPRSPCSQQISQSDIETEQNLLDDDHDYNQWVFKEPLNQKGAPSKKLQEEKFSDQNQNLSISTKNDFQFHKPQSHRISFAKIFNEQLNQQKNHNSVSKNTSVRLQSKEPIANQQISSVKYRLDQLMNRFPIESFHTGKKEGDFRKKIQIFDKSAPQMELRKTNSINDGESLNFQLRFNEYNEVKRDPQTEGKILIMEEASEPQTKIPSEEFLPRNTESKGGAYSLNYSESGYNQASQISMSKPQTQSLHQQIHEQEEAIQTYKQIILRLENENFYLMRFIQNTHQPFDQQIISHGDLNPLQSFQAFSNGPFDPQKRNFLDHPYSERKENHKSNSLNKFQREQSNNFKLHSSQNENLEIQSNHSKPSKIKISIKNTPNLQHQVQILESEKCQLLKKIDWLNSVVEEMMNMGNRAKTQKSVILDNAQSSDYRNSKRSRQHSGDIDKVSRVIQTSFIGFQDFIGKQNCNYKQLYEKQIEYQQHMKQEINQLSELQDAYAVQFRKILKEINQIKKNRAYYQELKKEIQKSKEKSLKRKQALKTSRSPVIHYESKLTPKRVFENQIVYQLKSENEYLISQYLKLKQLYAKEKANANNLSQSLNQINVSVQTVQPEEAIFESTTKNVFANKNSKKRQKILQRDLKVSDSIAHGERPASYGNFNFPITNRTDESRSRLFEKRKNGTICCLSQVEETAKSRNYLNLSQSTKKGKYQPGKVRNLSMNSDRQHYQPMTQKRNFNEVPEKKKFMEDEAISRVVECPLAPKIVEEQKQRSSNCTHETSQNMIGRYNNFIKNMKKRFGINSSIIGKEIPTHEDPNRYDNEIRGYHQYKTSIPIGGNSLTQNSI